MDGEGQLLPETRRWVYSPVTGTILSFDKQPGENIEEDGALVRMFDVKLASQFIELKSDIESANDQISKLTARLSDKGLSGTDISQTNVEITKQRATRDAKLTQRDELPSPPNPPEDTPGFFRLN